MQIVNLCHDLFFYFFIIILWGAEILPVSYRFLHLYKKFYLFYFVLLSAQEDGAHVQ